MRSNDFSAIITPKFSRFDLFRVTGRDIQRALHGCYVQLVCMSHLRVISMHMRLVYEKGLFKAPTEIWTQIG